MTLDAIIQYSALAISSLLGLIVKNLYSRLDNLESDMKKKLDKQDYGDDQKELKQDIQTIQQNILDLPQRIITILKDTGNL